MTKFKKIPTNTSWSARHFLVSYSFGFEIIPDFPVCNLYVISHLCNLENECVYECGIKFNIYQKHSFSIVFSFFKKSKSWRSNSGAITYSERKFLFLNYFGFLNCI